MNLTWTKWPTLLLLSGLLIACGTEAPIENDDPGEIPAEDRMPPLENLDALTDGAPSNDDLPAQAKADEIFPASFDLLATQSPVRSQGSRGVCSMFSTVALMEHLYIKEGTIPEPNFSEQFLQWSTKIEVGRFQNTDGSNAQVNLQAISQHGIVLEEDWPYETQAWNTSDHEDCEGDDRPVFCYTNGDPPEEALAADRYRLPNSQWVSTRTNDLKAYMYNNERAIVVGGAFYYQSWNHGVSTLPTNSEYWRNGWVLFPNEDDRRESEANRAGHSILLVGWDDNLEVPRLDGEGNQILDDDGEPVVERGFFLFKNSWGTGSFGRDSVEDGYGWISYEYVRQFKSARATSKPLEHHFPQPEELTCEDDELICDDACVANDEANCGACGVTCGDFEICDGTSCVDAPCDPDNVDCMNVDCLSLSVCEGDEDWFSYDDVHTIPDNDPTGLTTSIDVDAGGLVQSVAVDVLIEHTYNGDIRIELTSPSGTTALLREDDGTPGQDILESYETDAFFGEPSEGTWELKITDTAALDEGTLVGWYLQILR